MSRIDSWQQYKEEAVQYTVDWSVKVGQLSTSVSTVTWTVESGSSTISGESLTSDVATALITTNSTGCALIKVKATLADGQIDVHFFKVQISDPNCVDNITSINRY